MSINASLSSLAPALVTPFITQNSKTLITLGFKGNIESFSKKLLEYKWARTRSYTMALIMLAIIVAAGQAEKTYLRKDSKEIPLSEYIIKKVSQSKISNLFEHIVKGDSKNIASSISKNTTGNSWFRRCFISILLISLNPPPKPNQKIDKDEAEKKEKEAEKKSEGVFNNFLAQVKKMKKIRVNRSHMKKLTNAINKALGTKLEVSKEEIDEPEKRKQKAKTFSDDTQLAKNNSTKFSNNQRIILAYCLSKTDTSVTAFETYHSIFDLDQPAIDAVKKYLPDIKKGLSSGEPYRILYDILNSHILYNVKSLKFNFDINNEAEEKLSTKIFQNTVKELEKLLEDYGNDVEKHSSKDLEDSNEIIQKILKEFEKYAKDGNVEKFEALAHEYGTDSNEINQGLRKLGIKTTNAEGYAYLLKKVEKLRKGLLKHSAPLNEKEFNLYRYTRFNGVVGMLTNSMLLPKNWKKRLKDNIQKEIEKKELELASMEIGPAYRDIAESISELKETIDQAEKADRRDRLYSSELYTKKIYDVLSKKPIIRDKAFLSTFASGDETKGFGGCKFIITCKPKTVHAADISKLSGLEHEQERLFVPNQLFRVTKVEQDPYDHSRLTIYMDTTKGSNDEDLETYMNIIKS